ncbi:uncharacterized protein [Oscarella lobularis]|uniref:uncharacterized protein isoform X3 n=1 Tax=Oscarella lobularis TaxID=121494 RepID=UPI00331438DE
MSDQLDAFVPDMDNGDMKKMSKGTVKDSLDTLGKQSFRPDQARSLLMGADASSFTKDDVSKAGSLRPFIRSDQVKSMDAEAADEVAKQVKEPRKPMDQTLANHFFGRRAGKVNGTVKTKNLTCADMAEAAGQTAGLSTREQKHIPDSEVASCVKRIAWKQPRQQQSASVPRLGRQSVQGRKTQCDVYDGRWTREELVPNERYGLCWTWSHGQRNAIRAHLIRRIRRNLQKQLKWESRTPQRERRDRKKEPCSKRATRAV